MEGFQDIFCNSAFAGSVNGNGNNRNCYGRNSDSINISSNSFIFQPFGEGDMATNLTETNNGVARQSNLIEEVIEHQQRQPDTSHRNFFNCNPNFNKPKVFVPDHLVTDLSRRVNSLSLTERQQAQNDMCGYRLRQSKEDPLEVSMWMNEMDVLIGKGISGNDKRFSALRLAMHSHGHSNGNNPNNNIGAEYVRSQKLMFLRSADWSGEAAVYRMAIFFELKLEHFGSEALIRDLTMKDLSLEELELWKRFGFMQISKERDAFGRRIMCYFGKQFQNVPIATIIKCIVLFSTIMARDVSLQLDGIAVVYWGIGQQISTISRASQFILTFKALPMRLVARHICYNTDSFKALFPLTAQIAQTWGVVRIVIHKGPAMECFYNLMTYGIPRTAIPISNDGVIDTDFHLIFTKGIGLKEDDDEKRIRQERLDKQIQQFQVQNQISYISDNSRGSQGIPDQRGEPYQRQPPNMSIEEGYNKSERSSLLSWNMSGLSGLEPQSLPSDKLECLPDDLMRRLTESGNNAMGSTISNIGTTSPTKGIGLKEDDDEKRIRQERLDKQIQQCQVQNQISYISDNSGGSQGIPDQRGEPYQRQPPNMSIEEGYNKSERSSLLSRNMSGLSGLEPQSLPFDKLEWDDFMRRLAEPGNSSMCNTISNIGTTSPRTSSVLTPPDNMASRNPRQTERSTNESVFVPGLLDVIMGRGRHNKKKPGNQKLNQLLECYQDEYEASDKFQKTVLSEVVVSRMTEDGSRFLVRERRKAQEVWVEVSLEKARDKVAHDFRNLRRNAKIAKNAASTHQNEICAPKRQRSLTNGVEGHDDSKAKKPSSMRI